MIRDDQLLFGEILQYIKSINKSKDKNIINVYNKKIIECINKLLKH